MKALLLARFTFREARRKRMVLGVLLLSALFLALYWYGFSSFRSNYDARVNAGARAPFDLQVFASVLVLLGFYTVNFLSGIMAIFAAVGSVASEIDQGTLQAIVPKPIRRWEVLLGKWLGYAAMLAMYATLMCLGVLAVGQTAGGYLPANWAAGTALVVLVSLMLLSVTVLGSTVFSALTNGIVVFMLYGVTLMAGVVEQVGTFLNNETLMNIGLAANLVLPSDAIWRLAAYTLQPAFALPVIPLPFAVTTPPSGAMIVYAGAYTVGAIVLAVGLFNRRDL